MRRLSVLVAAILAIAAALVLAYHCARGAIAVLTMAGRGYSVDWREILFALPALLLIPELLLSAWRALRWIVAGDGSSGGGASNERPRVARMVMLIAAAPLAGVILAAVLQNLRVWSDPSIGVWQLLILPCLLFAPILMLLGYPKATRLRGTAHGGRPNPRVLPPG